MSHNTNHFFATETKLNELNISEILVILVDLNWSLSKFTGTEIQINSTNWMLVWEVNQNLGYKFTDADFIKEVAVL